MRKNYPKLCIALIALAFGSAKMGYGQAYINALTVPPTLDQAFDTLSLDVEMHDFNPGGYIPVVAANNAGVNYPADTVFGPVQTFAFNAGSSLSNSYLGPTMIWRQGREQHIHYVNNLPGNDTSTVHLHGAHVPAWVDGGPHGKIFPGGGTRDVTFQPLDRTCTLWYHPHGLEQTYTQVQMGLAGMTIVEDAVDPVRNALPHTYGVDDFPIIVQDIFFRQNSTTDTTMVIDTLQAGAGRVPIINGTYQPYLNVPPQKVRFRVLDGSTRWAYVLGIGDSTFTPQNFTLIASDGGYMSPFEVVDHFLTGSGIRNELVFDFTGKEGQTFYLLNLRDSMPANSGTIIGNLPEGSALPAFIKFNVGTTQINPAGPLPTPPAIVPYPTFTYTKTRAKSLIGQGGPVNPAPFSIDGLQYEPGVINDTVQLDSTEIWTVYNQTNVAHPFHIHDIQFFVTSVVKATSGTSDTIPIPVEYKGWKDDILVLAHQKFTFVTKFDDFGTLIDPDSTYMYHCHILTHEDGYYSPTGNREHTGMMQQFVVYNPNIVIAKDPQSPADNITLYPNPAQDVINLKGTSINESQLRIFDLSGKLLLSKTLPPLDGTLAIDISKLQTGMVLVEWESPLGRMVRKVVIE
jgi:FtsP/CotA-like multicopper oxidase with cupredoxin domain